MAGNKNIGSSRTYGGSQHNEFVNPVIQNVNFGSGAESPESKCLLCLYTSDYESHKSRNPKRVDGTLEWFLDHEKYRHWQEEKSGLLWVTADPGCGKSVLAAFLVDELKIQPSRRQDQTGIQDTPEVVEPRSTVCFFFFKDDNQEQKTATYALSALLHQLFSVNPVLLRHAMDDYKGKGEKFAQEFGTLWRIFKAATTDPDCGNVICIVDALDECEETTRKKLIANLVSMYTHTDQMFLKFILTSRPYGEIERPFKRLPSIRLKAEEQTPAISADIGRVVNSEVEELGIAWCLNDGDRTNLRDKLIQGADRTFLWVSLIFKILHGSHAASPKEFLDTLNTLPSDLDTVYEKILGDSRDRKKAKRILQIVVAATRPLTLDEMDIALAIQPDHKSIEDLEPCRLYSFETTVKDICGLFVKVIDSKIYLIHQTAKEFLMKRPTAGQAPTEQSMWKQSLCPVESNLTLAKSCIYYLLFTVFEARPLTPRVGQQEIDQFAEEHVFLGYAASNWAAHVLEAEMWEDEDLSTTALQVFKSGPGRLLTWFLVYQKANAADTRQYFDSTNINSLATASLIGHEAAVKRLIEKGEDVNGCRSLFGNALNVAALTKNRDVGRLLLNNGAIVYLYGGEFRNLLKTRRKDFRNWAEAARAEEEEWAEEAAEEFFAAAEWWELRAFRRAAARSAAAARRAAAAAEEFAEIAEFLEDFCLEDDRRWYRKVEVTEEGSTKS